VLKIGLDQADTAALPIGWLYHEAAMTMQSGAVVVTAMQGQLRIDPSWN
jgi:hypothetical protein